MIKINGMEVPEIICSDGEDSSIEYDTDLDILGEKAACIAIAAVTAAATACVGMWIKNALKK